MKVYFKIIFSTLASLLLLGIVTLVALPFMVDLNDFKTQIETAVQDNTGRALMIEGELELSIFPWLGITTGKMTLNNPQNFTAQPFAQITESQIKVKLVPLLFKEIEVSEVVLKGLHLNLLKNLHGVNNWDDLAALIMDKQNQKKSPLKLLEIAGLLIKEAHIVWDDQQTGQKIEMKTFNFNSDKLVFNNPFQIKSDFKVHQSPLNLTETIKFSGILTLNEEFTLFSLKKIKLQSESKGKFIPMGKVLTSLSGNANFDSTKQVLKFTSLELKTGELSISSPVFTAWLEKSFRVEAAIHIPNFDVAEFIQHNSTLKLPAMVDEKALTWLAADFNFHADAKQLRLNNLEIQLDETTLKGSARIKNFANPAVDFNLALDIINMDRYLPPPNKENNSHILNAPPGSAIATTATLFPVETLKKLNVNGQLIINDLKLNNLTMQGVKLMFNAENGFVHAQHSVDRLYQGAYKGKVVLDVNHELPILTMQQQLSHIQVEPLLTNLQGQSRFSGLVNLNFKLEAMGNNEDALKSSLNGRLNFLGRDLLIRGFNLSKIIANDKILLSSTPLPNENNQDQTAFSKVTAIVIMSNGFFINNDLLAIAPKIKVSGMGGINLVSQQLDYQVMTRLIKENTLAQVKETHNLPVFITMGGTFNDPIYQVDLAAMGVSLH